MLQEYALLLLGPVDVGLENLHLNLLAVGNAGEEVE